MEKIQHPFANVLKAIADGETIQMLIKNFSDQDVWVDVRSETIFYILGGNDIDQRLQLQKDRVRIKPRTILVNGVEVPAPMTEAPRGGDKYWTPTLSELSADSFAWGGDRYDQFKLTNGLCHATREAAILHHQAILSPNSQHMTDQIQQTTDTSERHMCSKISLSMDALKHALEFVIFVWRDVSLNEYAEERRLETEMVLDKAISELTHHLQQSDTGG